MTHSDLFCSGIAGAPPTDWREYDSIYTERYMSTPQDNPEGYDATSVILAAENLHGRLRIVHGTMDDNVHMQNTIRLVKALQDADKDFEVMIYPGFRHGIFNRHYQRTTNEFILETLRVTKDREQEKDRPRATVRSQADEWYDAGD
jgi:dipeptidyl-peptidase-4